MQTVHVRVNDAATGRPTPVRVRFTGPDGTYHAPLGRLTEFATGRNQDVGANLRLGTRAFAYIDGTCEIPLPAGPLHVEIARGPEYTPLSLDTELPPGKLALRFTVERWADLRRDGWYPGDTRAHFLPPHAALLEAAAEDLAVVNLLAAECRVPGPFGRDYPAVPNLTAFSGQQPALTSPGHVVVVNTHNTHPLLGSLGLLNCHRVVYPLAFGGPYGADDWSLADWCDQCHRKGGLVVWTRAWHECEEFRYGEPLADLALGKVDAFEIDYFEDSPFDVLPDWYALLSCGWQVPLVGGSGKDSNSIALGALRTYARLLPGEEFTYRAWIEAVRAGRTYVTNGPLLSLRAGDVGPGGLLELSPAGETVRVEAEARGVVPFDRLELLRGNRVVASAEPTGTPASASLEADVPVAESGWLAARCTGQTLLPHGTANQRVFAHTSPVYVRVGGRPVQAVPAVVSRLARELDRMLDWARHKARCPDERHRERLCGIFQAAREALPSA